MMRKERYNLAVGHLQSAHIAYKNVWQKFNSDFGQTTKAFSFEVACKKDRYVCYLMALCYVYLREFKIAQDCLDSSERADRAYDEYSKGLDKGGRMFLTFSSLITHAGNAMEAARNKTPWVNTQDLRQLIGRQGR